LPHGPKPKTLAGFAAMSSAPEEYSQTTKPLSLLNLTQQLQLPAMDLNVDAGTGGSFPLRGNVP
jgi:hypothetical protein